MHNCASYPYFGISLTFVCDEKFYYGIAVLYVDSCILQKETFFPTIIALALEGFQLGTLSDAVTILLEEVAFEVFKCSP